MILSDFTTATDSRVCGGSEFTWGCFPNARYMDIANIDGEEVVGCVFNYKTQEVYSVEAFVYEDNVAFRWIDQKWVNSHIAESTERGFDPDQAYDDVKFTNIIDETEILNLARKIVHKTYVHSHKDMNWDQAIKEASIDPSSFDDHMKNQPPDMGSPDTREYNVSITSVHKIDVTATNMEEAVEKAKSFVSGMKPVIQVSGTCWMDNYFSKVDVSRQLVSEHYEG
jgi:hypothetical protein